MSVLKESLPTSPPELVNNGFITILNISPLICAFIFSKEKRTSMLQKTASQTKGGVASFKKYVPQVANTGTSTFTI